MSFSSEFDSGLATNLTRLGEISNEFTANINKNQSELASLNKINAKYASLIAGRKNKKTKLTTELSKKQTANNDAQSKIAIIQGLSTAEKDTIYQVYMASKMNKQRYMDIVLDRYSTIISRADPIIQDNSLSTANRDMLLESVLLEEYALQKQTIDYPKYIVTNF